MNLSECYSAVLSGKPEAVATSVAHFYIHTTSVGREGEWLVSFSSFVLSKLVFSPQGKNRSGEDRIFLEGNFLTV